MPEITRSKKKKHIEGSVFFDTVYEICMFLLFTGYFLFYEVRVLQLLFVGIGVAGSALQFIVKAYLSQLKLPLNTLWYFLFFVLAEVSAFWAHSPTYATQGYLKLMVLLILISLGYSQYVNTTRQAERLLQIFVFSAVVISLAQLVFTPVNDWFSGYFGSEVGGNNTNTFGFVVAIAAIISFYFAYVRQKRLYYIFTILLLICSVFSSSRKSLGAILGGILILVFFAVNKKHRFLHLTALSLVSVFSVILLLEDEVLHSIIGYRFDSLFDFLIEGSTNRENSINFRKYFIDFAKILFNEKPIYGHGFANFSIILLAESNANQEVYAHNNYWEILADLGIIGLISYYWFHAWLAIKILSKLFVKKISPILSLAITLLISQLILDWGMVSMISFYPQAVLSLIFVCSYASDSDRKYHYSPQQMR